MTLAQTRKAVAEPEIWLVDKTYHRFMGASIASCVKEERSR